MASAFTAVCLLVLTLSLCQVATARTLLANPTPVERVQMAFQVITKLSYDLRIETQNINLINAPLRGNRIPEGFKGIISTVADVTSQLNSPYAQGTFNNADAKLVVASLKTFVQVHQALLNVVIGKHGLLTLIPFFEPIRVALVNLEAGVDSFALALINLIPTQQPAADDQFGALRTTVSLAIEVYSGPAP